MPWGRDLHICANRHSTGVPPALEQSARLRAAEVHYLFVDDAAHWSALPSGRRSGLHDRVQRPPDTFRDAATGLAMASTLYTAPREQRTCFAMAVAPVPCW